ncbi:MAG TPA: hypothetical protein VM939_06075 [Gemmatimonadaceae bacterium]|nr:hypothetical protein [Gemmatimonadaceae bacterium]
MRSFWRLIPVLVVVIVGLALVQIFSAFLALRSRDWMFALFYGVFGLAGIVLARALWTHRAVLNRTSGD